MRDFPQQFFHQEHVRPSTRMRNLFSPAGQEIFSGKNGKLTKELVVLKELELRRRKLAYFGYIVEIDLDKTSDNVL
jgi:hypothetical protein